MQATARRAGSGLTHSIAIRDHRLTADEPRDHGGDDAGPCPEELLAAALAACTAMTIELYAQRKGWELDAVEVRAAVAPDAAGGPARVEVVLRLPAGLDDEQVERLRTIAARCPVHRTLERGAAFSDRVERIASPA